MVLPFPYSIQVINDSPIVNLPILPNDLVNSGNQIQSSRAINPVTQDYELNTNGTFVGQSAIQTSVYLALFTTFNSSAVVGLGNQLKSIKIVGNNIVNQVTNIINQSLASLLQQNIISLINCAVTNLNNGNINVQVFWQDLTNSQTGQQPYATNLVIGTN